MEITRYDIIKIIDFVRNNIFKQDELNSLLEVDLEYESEDLILGISNEFLSDFAEMISGHKIKVVGEVEELYVKPEYRSIGIGRRLFQYAEECVKEEADYITLSTATKNYKAILHFYLDELELVFWSARLFKKI